MALLFFQRIKENESVLNHIISRNVVVFFYISLILILVLPFVIGYYLKNMESTNDDDDAGMISIWNAVN